MKRKGIVTALLLAALLAVSGLCAAEEMPATPTDLAETDTEPESGTEPVPVCAHENVSQVIYFFDSPSYTSLSAASHRVSGPGVVHHALKSIPGEPLDVVAELIGSGVEAARQLVGKLNE